MATLQQIRDDRHKWEIDPTKSTKTPGGTRYRLKEKYKNQKQTSQSKKKGYGAKKPEPRPTMKERLVQATNTRNTTTKPKTGSYSSRPTRTEPTTKKVTIKPLAAPSVLGRKKYNNTQTGLKSTDKPASLPTTTAKKSTTQRGTSSPTTTKTGLEANILKSLDKPTPSKGEIQRLVKRYIRSLTRKPGTRSPTSVRTGLRSKGGKVSRRGGGKVEKWQGGNLEVSQFYD